MIPEWKSNDAGERVASWTLPFAATLGSSVRRKGIFQAMRLQLPPAARKALAIKSGELTLRVSDGEEALAARIAKALDGIEARPVIPREIEDILAISATERHRWLKDGRLQSAGTRTVKLRGRARQITFHVFEPAVVEDLLNREAVLEWREQDAVTAAENRRRAAWKAKLTRSQKAGGEPASAAALLLDGEERPNLLGWEEFERDGLLG